LRTPSAIAFDALGNLFIADNGNNRIRALSSTGIITTVAGNGSASYAGDGASALNTAFWNITSLAIDSAGRIYVADTYNNAIRLLTPMWTEAALSVASTHSGSFGAGGSGAYTLTVSNAPSTGATSGTVTVTELPSTGLAVSGMNGTGWNCAGNTCTRADALNASSSYPTISVTVDVSGDARSQATNQATVSGGGSAKTGAQDVTVIAPAAPAAPALISPSDGAIGVSLSTAVTWSQSSRAESYDVYFGASTPPPLVTGTTGVSYSPGTLTSGATYYWAIGARNSAGAAASGAWSFTAGVGTKPALSIVKSHAGNFTQGQIGAAYLVTVSNQAGAAPTSGAVTVTETVPPGLTLVSMAGTGWACPGGGTACTRNDALAAGASYPAIMVTVNVASNAASPQVNAVSVSGGGSADANASDSTTVTAISTHTVAAGSASAAPGSAFSIPVTLTLTSGVTADALTFGLQITPVGSAPALTGSLSFTKDGSITDAPFVSTGGTSNAISVVWSSLSTALSGTHVIGVIGGTVPSGAVSGQSYTVAITGASAAGGGGVNPIAVSAGANATLTVAIAYKVGDVYPYTSDTAPNFGDGTMNILDLIQELFAVNNIPGFRPAACSDRFDAMDLYPVDTGTTRGGDGVLEIRDLIRELFRVNNLDLDRPVRASRGGACAFSGSAAATSLDAASRNGGVMPVRRAPVSGALALGEAERQGDGSERVPVYLEAGQDLTRVAVTFGLGDQRSRLRFAATAETPPSLAQDGQVGVVAVAWLDGVSVRAGARLLLGYVAGPAGAAANLKVYGVSASGLEDNREVRLTAW
jgi:uncharacterized repeat protein (TIGR01451 family)